MVEINEQILRAYGIYKTRKLKPGEREKILKIKKGIEKIIHIPVERIYIINESAWGREPEKSELNICVLVDKRYKDIDEARESLRDYAFKNRTTMMFWTLCQFELRKDIPTEEEYFIERYGIKVYDSGKETEINEKLEYTKYAEFMDAYRFVRNYPSKKNIDFLMNSAIQMYILKIGYFVRLRRENDLHRDINFAKLVSKDQNVISLLDKYLDAHNEKKKTEIFEEFEKYVKKIKQVKILPKIKEKPTMKVYEKLLKQKEEKGILDIKTLTKEDLYTMYLIQDIDTFKIADLYGVENKVINSKRNNWQIKLREKFFFEENSIISEEMKLFMRNDNKYTYNLLVKQGFMGFEKCFQPILEYMIDENIYLLKEFWQFTKKEENEIISWMISKKNTECFYQANISLDILLKNELIEEVDFKQYKITKKGKEFFYYCNRKRIDKIGVLVIYEYCKKEDNDDDILEKYEYLKIIRNLENSNHEDKNDNEEQSYNLELIDHRLLEAKDKSKNKSDLNKNIKPNYSKINDAKIEFGKKCEEMVYKYEIDRLMSEGREDKANEVEWISRDKGDGYGYDIESFEEIDGVYEKIYIEVKGTDKDVAEPFEISSNEVDVSEKLKDRYYIYRVGKANTKNPKFYKIRGSVRENFDLETKVYTARANLK